MGTNTFNILSVNAGSSSIKLSLHQYDVATQQTLATQTKTLTTELNIQPATEAIAEWVRQVSPHNHVDAIGHRVVHGGPNHSSPAIITDELIADLSKFANFDPEHLPLEISLINKLRVIFPDAKQVACFDTAFFYNLPSVAKILPLPSKYQAEGLRRYGFHGLSYAYLQQKFREIAGDTAVNGRVIYAHLGSGASMAATKDSVPLDTTMGFTPASGLIMSTRSGDIDPGLALYFNKQHGVSPEQFNHMVNFESGLLGVSGLSPSMLTLLERGPSDENSQAAVDLFVYQSVKAIGALTAVLGGVDSLIFSGGIGEKSAIIRSRICERLGYLGIVLDQHSNMQDETLVSAPDSKVGVHVIPTDESAIIVSQVIETIFTNSNVETN